MDIRTRLALSLVSVSLLSMALLGAFAYHTAEGLLQEITVRQLDALAEGKKRDLEKIQEGWRGRVELIKQRVISTAGKDDISPKNNLSRELGHILAGVDNVSALRVLDYSIDMVLDSIGPVIMEVVVDGTSLKSVTNNYTGLGETGESMIFKSGAQDNILVLNEVRHVVDQKPSTHMSYAKAPFFMTETLARRPGVFIEGAEDYRKVEVWVASRFVADLALGIVVKVDAIEERQRSLQLRSAMIDIGIALSAFAIIGGTLLGLYLARPIHNLAELVQRIRLGESGLRAEVDGDDEIAYLSDSLNALLEHVQKNAPLNSRSSESPE